MRRVTRVGVVALALLGTATSHAQWRGFEDRSAERGVERYDFGTAGGSNENYYDGDMGDYDGDGKVDTAIAIPAGAAAEPESEPEPSPVGRQRKECRDSVGVWRGCHRHHLAPLQGEPF